MAYSKIIFKSKEEIYGLLLASRESVHYQGILTIKDVGEKPVSLNMTFIPPHPFVFAMPLKQSIKAETITQAYTKVVKFFKKYGIELH